MLTDTLETRAAMVHRRPDGIVESRGRGVRLELEDARAIYRAVRALMPGQLPCRMLVVPSTKGETSREARDYIARSDDALAVVGRAAFVITSPLSRVIATVFIGLNKPAYPTAAFCSEAEAVAWLLAAEP